jgi:cytochrome c-type biogenesis protein CcmH
VKLLAGTLVLCAVMLSLADPALAERGPRAADLEAEIVCPTCKTTLDQSDSPIARRMKSYIRERVTDGATAKQIKDELVAEFGPGVLAEPPKQGFDLLAWLLPLGILVGGAVAVGCAAWVWSRRRPGDDVEDAALDPDLERRVDEELTRFEQ